MSIIRAHDITLKGEGGGQGIVLRPLTDAHLPLLYRWCADPEVLYWTEGGEADEALSYPPETVDMIYGGVSREAYCFLIEAEGAPVGECWLQRMNLPYIREMYPAGTDVRRIDLSIGEKAWWGRGIGTTVVGMLAAFAFGQEGADVLHCLCEDYNIRSCRIWEKNGFRRVRADALPEGQKGKYQYHFRLTKAEYEAKQGK